MKKILSLFLSSLILLSLFSGFTVSAATVTLDDGSTLHHKWDFETSIADTVNGKSPNTLVPVRVEDPAKGWVGEFTKGTQSITVFPSNSITSTTDRYAVAEFDFKQGATNGYTYFRWRDTTTSGSAANLGIYRWDNGATDDWMHIILVVDGVANASGKYNVSAFSVNNGVYTNISHAAYLTIATKVYGEFRIELSGTEGNTMYMDNLELKSYNDFYTAINSADSVEKIVAVATTYSGLGLYGISSDFNKLTAVQKSAVAEKLLNKNFESDDAVVAEMNAAMTDLVIATKYLDWDFENGTLNDAINNEPFMTDHPSEPDPARVVIADDPTGANNKVAKMPIDPGWSAGSILTYTDVVDNAVANNEFDYLTVDFKIYGDSTSAMFPVYLNIRHKSTSTQFYIRNATESEHKWLQFKGVVNIPENKVKTYMFNNGTWVLKQENTLPEGYGFYRFEFLSAGTSGDVHYDDFKITGYKNVIAEVMEASAAGVADVLEVYDELQIIELPASYATLDDAGKLALGTYIKSKVTATTTVAELNKYIKIGASSDELVVLESVNNDGGKLDSLKLVIKKAGVNLATAQLIVATYANDGLEDVKVCDIETAIVDGSEFEVTELNLDLVSAESAKLILINNLQNLVPTVKATLLK